MDKKYKVELTALEIEAVQAVLGIGHLKQRPMIVRSIELGILKKLNEAVVDRCPDCGDELVYNILKRQKMCYRCWLYGENICPICHSESIYNPNTGDNECDCI